MNAPDTEDFNPFAAPEVPSDNDISLRANQSFLLWNSYILCQDVAELPRVCIVYGDCEGLKPRTFRHSRLTTWWATSLSLGAVAVAALITMVLNSGSIAVRDAAAPVVAIGTLAFVTQLCVTWLWGRHKMRITYYVGAACRKQERRKRMAVLVLCLAAATLLGVLATANQPGSNRSVIIKLATGGLVIGFLVRVKTQLHFKRRKHGLNAIGGHSEAFTVAVGLLNRAASSQRPSIPQSTD
ncbi:MAG: hypothetical protein WAO83_11525 [Fuerstiella sp.]